MFCPLLPSHYIFLRHYSRLPSPPPPPPPPPLPSSAPLVFPRGHPLLLALALATCLAGEEEEEGWEGEGRPGQVTTGTGGGEVEGLVGGAEALPLPLPPTREMTTRGRQLPMLRPAGGDRVAQATSLREPLKRERALKTV